LCILHSVHQTRTIWVSVERDDLMGISPMKIMKTHHFLTIFVTAVRSQPKCVRPRHANSLPPRTFLVLSGIHEELLLRAYSVPHARSSAVGDLQVIYVGESYNRVSKKNATELKTYIVTQSYFAGLPTACWIAGKF
jgi:hypothetical protein